MSQKIERPLGLHLRINETLLELAHKALRLELPIFQIFLMDQHSRRLFTFTDEQITEFRQLRNIHFKQLYMHGSYLINLAGVYYNGMQILYREIGLAKRLGFTDIVLHPGSAHGAKKREIGFDNVAKVLNKIMKYDTHFTFILENTAHGNMSIGSDITDFYHIRQKLDKPEKVRFCFDTAHAHVYGYDLVDPIKREELIQLLDTCMGLENISLIHLNDTDKSKGSRIDKHDAVGKGVIGIDTLKQFAMDTRFSEIPLLMELPLMDESQEKFFVAMVRDWHIKK